MKVNATHLHLMIHGRGVGTKDHQPKFSVPSLRIAKKNIPILGMNGSKHNHQ